MMFLESGGSVNCAVETMASEAENIISKTDTGFFFLIWLFKKLEIDGLTHETVAFSVGMNVIPG